MATPSSSSSTPDPIPPPPTTTAASNPLRPSPLPLRRPIFTAQPQPLDHPVAMPNPVGFIRHRSPTASMAMPPQARPFVFSSDHAVHVMRPHQTQFLAPRPVRGGSSGSGPVKTVPIPFKTQVSSFPTVSPALKLNGCKDRDKNREDILLSIRDRKVILSEGGSDSLYALCRSWVRNGLPQDNQPNFGDSLNPLPKPLPASLLDDEPSTESGGGNEAEYLENNEPVGSIEQLSTSDLLDGLVKRSKRVRAQFKKRHLRRIDRYKQRLYLLIPNKMGKSDTTPGN